MNTRVGFIDSDLRENISDRSERLENVANGISKRVKRYCLGRLARDLEVRNCLKNVENNATHPGASACAAEVSIQLERLDE
jgi:hypothetical protein